MSEDQFNSIMSILNQISQSLILMTDQIRSNQSFKSDQIRSDQISNIRSNSVDNWMDKFIEECSTYSIDCTGKDLRTVEQGVLYYLQNKSKIISRKKYILSILGPCQDMQISKEIHADPRPASQKKVRDSSDENLILGYDKDLVLSKVPYLDENIFRKQIGSLDKTYKTFFTTYEAMITSEMKRNLFTAICMKNGLL